MGLIHWWPLNGNLRDYGLNDITLTNNGATVNSAGKVGSCYLFDGSNDYMTPGDITITSSMTFACWLKFNGTGSYHIIDCRAVSGETGYQPMYGGINYGLQVYSSAGGSYTWSAATCGFSTGVWYHIAVVYTSTNATLYINGVSKDTKSGTFGSNFGPRQLRLGTRCSGSNWFNGCLNDVRIYDYALSAKEVKEISKGLVLHYTFEDEYIESTTNLGNTSSNYSNMNKGTAYNASGWGGDAGTVTFYANGGYNNYPYKVYHKTATGTGGIYYKTANDIIIEAGKTYTMSVYIKASVNISNASNYSFNINRGSDNNYITYGASFNITTEWQRFTKTFTATSSQAGSYGEMSIIYDDTVTDYYIYYSGFQIEEKDHATPYVNGTRTGKVYDSSGYSNNGTVNGNLQISSNSGNGLHSLYIPNGVTDYISSDFRWPTETITMQYWWKSTNTSPTGSYHIPVSSNSAGQYEMSISSSGVNRNGLYVAGARKVDNGTSTKLLNGQWHLCTMTYNGSVIKRYVDGVSEKDTTASGALSGGTGLVLGHYGTNTSYGVKEGYIADFKVYATALSPEDVLAEYNRKAAIDKNGNLFTGEIVEVKSQQTPQIDKNNYVKTSTISEGLMTKMLSDGATFERIYFFDYDKAGSVWDSTTAKSCNTAGKFSVLGSLNSYVPSDGWYEFYYRENNNWVRWKQSYNPLSRVTSGTSGSSSEYTYIGGSANPYSSFSGLTRYTSDDSGSCYLRGAPSWWCAIAPYGTSYDVFPDMWGNSTANHHQELWIRIDNLKAAPEFNDNDVKLNSTGVMAGQIIEN